MLSPDFTQAVCDQPAAIEAVQFYTDLATKYKVAPDIALTATAGADAARTWACFTGLVKHAHVPRTVRGGGPASQRHGCGCGRSAI